MKKWFRLFCFGKQIVIFWHLKTGYVLEMPTHLKKRHDSPATFFINHISHYSTASIIVMQTFDFTKDFNSFNGYIVVVLINQDILIIV